ncbi:hypothetical protein ACP4OV_007223 [Aristida adscensionis]
MAPTAKNSPLPPELAVGSRPRLVKFSDDEQRPPAIMDPFDTGFREETFPLEMLQGKQCLACLRGEWLLMLDERTKECFLLSVASLSKISLPPLLLSPEPLYWCALSSSPALPDCTVMFATRFEDYLLYCRLDDEEWWELSDEANDAYELFVGDIAAGSRGRMYASTDMNTFIMVNTSVPSPSSPTIDRRGIPSPARMRWRCEKRLVESDDGDVFLLQLYFHGFHESDLIDINIHRLDTSEYVWNKVESIGDRTIFVGDNNHAVLLSASRAGYGLAVSISCTKIAVMLQQRTWGTFWRCLKQVK